MRPTDEYEVCIAYGYDSRIVSSQVVQAGREPKFAHLSEKRRRTIRSVWRYGSFAGMPQGPRVVPVVALSDDPEIESELTAFHRRTLDRLRRPLLSRSLEAPR